MEPILLALIPSLGGLLLALNTVLSRRTDKASAQVDTALKAMEGMRDLAADRLGEIDRLKAQVDRLEHDLADERAALAALAPLNDKLKGRRP